MPSTVSDLDAALKQYYHQGLDFPREREGTYKFHGGPLDGQVHTLRPANLQVRVAVCDAPQFQRESSSSTQTVGYTEHTYARELDPATNVVGYYWEPPR